MKITNEWDEVIKKIYNLISVNGLLNLDFTIPYSLFSEYKIEYQEEMKKELTHRYILLKVSSITSGSEISNTIKIKFGPKEKINKNKNEIIISFKYARNIVLDLITAFQPYSLNIKTIDLIDRKDSFSTPQIY